MSLVESTDKGNLEMASFPVQIAHKAWGKCFEGYKEQFFPLQLISQPKKRFLA
jgi:hypothetical protein